MPVIAHRLGVWAALVGAALLVGSGLSCIGSVVVHDGSTVSYGPSRKGILLAPRRIANRGVGYWAPPRWATRGLRYGTDELIDMIEYAGREIAKRQPGSILSIADLSLRRGGPSAWHRSHQHGRDVDIVLLAKNRAGKPVRTEAMRYFDADGRVINRDGTLVKPQPNLIFDDARNWELVKILMVNPIAEVQYIFVSDDLKQRMLDYAEAAGEPQALIQTAAYLVHQPSDSQAHNDHFHVRVFCDRQDRRFGCRDRGAIRWLKKGYKYERRRPQGVGDLLRQLSKPHIVPL